ncbi:MAG TPA: adenylate/guanylate cyclase domain-containing protein [Actinomycetaceae bacterium]|nr:adenylate/guanylate cyclase domain-containing protein [Actinomycetaceae bacterium]
MGELPSMTIAQLAEQAGTDVAAARAFWRAMGFANVADDEVKFVSEDVDTLRAWTEMVESEDLDERTMLSLIRAQSHNLERQVLWQLEATIEYMTRRHKLDDTAARIIFLDQLPERSGFLLSQLSYAWRRQAVDLTERTVAELAERTEQPRAGEVLPVPRALGFVDMVQFTSRVRQLESRELVDLVQGFEMTTRDVISANGARVVKTVGDAVLYVAEDLLTAAKVALAMIHAISANPSLLPVRASLVWGRVISRSGDIFGPAVNLASRLIDIAPRDTVYMDEGTAALLAKHPSAADFNQIRRPIARVPGIGEIRPIELKWAVTPSPGEIWMPNG